MISATSNWIAANASRAKQLQWIVQIRGYQKAFSTGVTGNIGTDLQLGGLCGCFTDGTGQIIGLPFAIGSQKLTMSVPVGATQLQLGTDDDIYSDNSGGFNVDVNGVSVFVPGDAMPWLWVNGGLNTNFQYGLLDGASPVVVAGLTTGQEMTIQYQSGTMTWGGIIGGGTPADGNTHGTQGNGLSGLPFAGHFLITPIYPWLVGIDDISLTVSDLEGGADLSDLTFNVQDNAQTITTDLAGTIFEGKQCSLLSGFNGLALTDFTTFFTGRIDSVDSANNNLEYRFTVPDIRKDLSQIVYQTADDGFPTDQNHLKTISGNPIDILLEILENQLGWATSQIDVAGLTNYRDTIFAGITFEFSIDSPPAAKDFIENEILKPLCGYHWPNNLGVFKVNFFYPLNPSSVATFDHTNLLNVPLAEQADLVDQVTYRFDADADGKFQAESVQNWSTGIAKYGLYGEQVIESAGLRSAFQGYFLAGFGARLIFLRYGDKQLQIEGLQTIWSESLLEPGDRISLTSSLVPDRANGVMGVTAKAFEILDRTWSPLSGVVTFKALEANTAFKQFLIAPNGEPDFTLDTPTNQAKYLYLSDAAGKYSDGSAANTLC